MTQLPAPPAIRVMAAIAACDRNTTHRPTVADVIDYHVMQARAHGQDFAPWSAEGDAAFRARRQVQE